LRSKVTDASLAIEVKIAESWTIEELEAALIDQLCGQYLRSDNARHGILLLVHQRRRNKGWRVGGSGEFLSFREVASHLAAMAAQISAGSENAAQPEIAAINVSGATLRNRKKAKQTSSKRPAEKAKSEKKVVRKKAVQKRPTPKTVARRRRSNSKGRKIPLATGELPPCPVQKLSCVFEAIEVLPHLK
jgi:hypothetical protein